MLISINPANDKVLRKHSAHDPAETTDILNRADRAFRTWRNTGYGERAALMLRASEVLKTRCDEFAELMALEMGKPIQQGRAEIDKCALVCSYYAQHAEAFLTDEIIETEAKKSFAAYQPLGVVLAVMPWNFPFWQVFRFAAPALMAGNAGVLKHASNVTGCALAIEQVFREAGFAEDLFQILKIGNDQVGAVIEHPAVSAVTLTGSGAAGRAVAAQAGQALKKTVLELGGSDPYIILDDADLDIAIPACVDSRLINSGQSCIAAKRFIVLESIKEEFEGQFVERMKQRKMGDPLDEQNDMGPLARTDLRDELHRQVEESIKEGATCLLGGSIPDIDGAYYPATVLTHVKSGMPAYEQELFGPVAAIISARDEREAVEIANDSQFGLGAAVFTRDVARGERIARELEAGCCFVNDYVKSDPRLPFGGIKESGYGRELSHAGIREFINIKAVSVR